MKLIKPFLTISGLTFVSKILGFFRDILIAAFVGAGFIACEFSCILNSLGVHVSQLIRGKKFRRAIYNRN